MTELQILTLDAETFYSDTYSLKVQSPVEYITDPRFECIGMSMRLDTVRFPMEPRPPEVAPVWDARAQWYDGDQVAGVLAQIDWTRTVLMSHNIGFDGAILAWQFGIVPMLYLDTLGLARASYPEAGGSSLDQVLTKLGAPPKQGDVLHKAKGWRLADMRAYPAFFQQYRTYCNRDTDGCFWILRELGWNLAGLDGVGRIHGDEEILHMDAVARMTILPQFVLNTEVVRQHLAAVQRQKEVLLAGLKAGGLLNPDNPRGDLQSADKFADMLRHLGVDPPTKISPTTGEEIYAFAKTDHGMQDLVDHPDPMVQAAAAARLGIKSTLEETRSERFIKIGHIRWPVLSNRTVIAPLAAPPIQINGFMAQLPRMPFPLKYSGAHTHRLSGEWLLNLQNLGRKSPLRRALKAPPGYLIVSADASQIEARVVAFLAGCMKLIASFAAGIDVYAEFATSVFGYPVNKIDQPMERFVGKTGILSLGYGSGHVRFKWTVYNQGDRLVISDELSERTVGTYRTDHREIPIYWNACEDVLFRIANRVDHDFGVILVDGNDQSLILPNGMRLYYRGLRRETVQKPGERDRTRWRYEYRRRPIFTYGAKVTENIDQALARIITMNAATRISRISGHQLAGQIHDQLVYVVPISEADHMKRLMVDEMSRQLDWWVGLPLAAEGAVGDNLLDAK